MCTVPVDARGELIQVTRDMINTPWIQAQKERANCFKQPDRLDMGSSLAAVALRPDGRQMAVGKHNGT